MFKIAEVRAVQSPATPSRRAPCVGDHFEHAQRQRRGLAFAPSAVGMRGNAVGSSRAHWERRVFVCFVNLVSGGRVCNKF